MVANAAIVPAGSNESISVYVTDQANAILDVNGYFGQPGSPGALSFYPIAPCRVADTCSAAGPFGGPELDARSTRSFAIPAGGCNIATTAAAYSMNMTVVPDGPLSYLTAWPTGSAQPNVSTLNSFDGAVVANAAIVPAGASGAVSVSVTDPTHVILDNQRLFRAVALHTTTAPPLLVGAMGPCGFDGQDGPLYFAPPSVMSTEAICVPGPLARSSCSSLGGCARPRRPPGLQTSEKKYRSP